MNNTVAFVLLFPLISAGLLLRIKSRPKTQQSILQIAVGTTCVLALIIFLQQPQLAPFLDNGHTGPNGLIGFGTTAFAAFSFLTVLLCPVSLQFRREALIIIAIEICTLLALLTNHLLVLWLGIILSALPIYLDLRTQKDQGSAKIFLLFQIIGNVALVISFISLYNDLPSLAQRHFFSIDQLAINTVKAPIGSMTSGLFALAFLLRIGAFPFHPQFIVVIQKSRYSGMITFIMSHLMLASMLKFGGTWLSHLLFPMKNILLSVLILSAAYFSILSLVQNNLRKLMGYQFLSFVSLGFSVFVTSTPKHPTNGATELLAMCSVFCGLFGILWIVSTHMGIENIKRYQGLAAKAPELATFFLLLGLTCAGLPGTVGYIAEEAMLQQSFHESMWRGIVLLLTMGCNAWVMFSSFSKLFLGPMPLDSQIVINTTTKEKAALLCLVTFLFLHGFLPNIVLH